jgi:hypothetical protein
LSSSPSTLTANQGVGMNVLAYDVRPNPVVEAMGIPYMPLEDILPLAHVVSLHVPLLPSTYEIMNRPRWVLWVLGGGASGIAPRIQTRHSTRARPDVHPRTT